MGVAPELHHSIIVPLQVAPAFGSVTNDVTTRRDVEEIPSHVAPNCDKSEIMRGINLGLAVSRSDVRSAVGLNQLLFLVRRFFLPRAVGFIQKLDESEFMVRLLLVRRQL